MAPSATDCHPLHPRLDALLLAALTIARIRIDTLADATLSTRQNDVARQPFLGSLLPAKAMKLLAQQQLVDPIGLLLIMAALGCLLAYLIASEVRWRGRTGYRVKLVLIWLIVLLTVFAPSAKMMLLRQGSGPASYTHDGGVIQTEAALNFALAGRNPYVEDYTKTPMAEWGFSEFRTALYHYPYLPWTFIFSAPFKFLADGIIGWYDQRMVYLLLFALTLALLPGLARRDPYKLLLVMVVGLNPIMGSDLIFGQNDSFVLAWIVLSLWLWNRGRPRVLPGDDEPMGGRRTSPWLWASAAAYGLACASKPTAWFLAPFYVLLLARPAPQSDPDCPEAASAGANARPPAGPGLVTSAQSALASCWPALAVALVLIGPYFAWNPAAMYDDVWKWANGTSTTAYQIWGWGASNLVLALGWVTTRFAYWPFWLPELIVGLPLMGWLLWRQWRENTIGRALWGYAVFLFAFFFVSRFLNENYLGYLTAMLALGVLSET